IVEQLKTEGLKIEVIPLRSLDAAATASLLKSLFGQEEDSNSNLPFFFRSRSSRSNNDNQKKPLSIEADADRNRLLVHGTEEQINEVRGVLSKLGESGVAMGGFGLDRGNFRVMRIGENDPAELAKQIQKIWTDIRPNTTMKVEVLGQNS